MVNDANQLSSDLKYVRGLVDPTTRPQPPRAVMLILGTIVLLGFPLPDFVGQGFILRYWLVAGCGGFLVCAGLGALAMRRSGQEDARAERRQLAHWGLLFLFGGLAFATGYCLLVQGVPYAWTGMGVLAALSLVLSAELARRRQVALAG